jgi:chromosome partitioning protein
MTTPIVVTVVNQKGGVLKTSVTVNLGAALARLGKRVLVVDLDAQQNLTHCFFGKYSLPEGKMSLYDAFLDEASLDDLIVPTSQVGLDVIPCTEEFVGADLSLANKMGREFVLRSCFEKTRALDQYDYVLCDNSPSISLVVVNSLVASSHFLVPCSAEYLPMMGLALLSNTIASLRKIAPDLQLLGVVLTKFSRSESICGQVAAMLKKDLGERLFRSRIRVNTKAKAAPSVQKTIFEYEDDTEGRGTEDFTALALEFIERLELGVGAGAFERVANG